MLRLFQGTRGRGVLAALLSLILVLPPQTAIAQSAPRAAAPVPSQPLHSKYSEASYAELKQLIVNTHPDQMDLAFLKKIYQFQGAKDMLKLIFSSKDPETQAKSEHLAELRKHYIWTILAEYAGKFHRVIEITNQGKSNGLTSDYDLTGNILRYAQEHGVTLEQAAGDVIKYLEDRLKDSMLTADALDITLFNGDKFLPDARDERLSVGEYLDRTMKGSYDLKGQEGAYWLPSANKEQTHDRALQQGRTTRIAMDVVSGRPTANGVPFEFDAKAGKQVALERDASGQYTVKGPLEEVSTRDQARLGNSARYEGVEGLPPSDRWVRSLGNVTQNFGEFRTHDDPVAQNKYFIERVIDQGIGRFTDLPPAESISGDPETPPTYVQMHGADPRLFKNPAGANEVKEAWKKVFIQRAFGLAENDKRIEEIQGLLDRAAEIQLDKIDTGRNASYEKRSQSGSPDYYYQKEWDHLLEHPSDKIRELQDNCKAEGREVPPEELKKLREMEARRLFFDAQGALIPEAAVRVAEETFRREALSPEGGPFPDAAANRKLKLDHGIELGRLLELVEELPLTKEAKASLRKRLLAAVPDSCSLEVKGMIELARRKGLLTGLDDLNLDDVTKASDGISDRPLFLEISQEKPASPIPSKEDVKKKFTELVEMKLGPVQADQFRDAWEHGKTAAVAKFGSKLYMQEITEQVDGLMLTGGALGMINAYQQNCIQQANWNEACLNGLAAETFNQVMFLLPGINVGLMVTSGMRELASREGSGWSKANGAANVAMGILSIPGVAETLAGPGAKAAAMLHIWMGFQLPVLAAAVTYSYAIQRMTSDGVEQAFKALKEPGKNARPFPTPNRSTIWNGDTPTIPLLADVISGKNAKGEDLVPADNLTDAERNQVAMQQSAPVIHAELRELGFQVGTPEWQAKRRELVVRYGMLLPYLQRTARIYQVFGPKVAALGIENDDVMGVCLGLLNEDVDKQFAAPPGPVDNLRYWWDKGTKEQDRQKALAEGWSKCLDRAINADEKLLTTVFDEYLDGWFAKQGDYARTNASLRPLLRAALMREYVTHHYLDQGAETERQMKKASEAVKRQSDAKIELLGKLLAKDQDLANQFGEKIAQAAPAGQVAKPKLVVRVPPYAVPAGDAASIDVSARGQYEPRNSGFAAGDEWKADLEAQVTKVSLSAPDNLIVTPELRSALAPKDGKAKQIVTIEEKVIGKLKDRSGAELSTAEAKITYYDLIDWQGGVMVEVRAAGADPKQTSPYPYAIVKLSGAAQAQKEALPEGADAVARARFEPLPVGSFSIHVEPRSTDQFHKPMDATVALTGVSESTDPAGKPVVLVGTGTGSVTVVLPYVPGGNRAGNASPPSNKAANTDTAKPPPAVAPPSLSSSTAPGTELAAECDGLLQQSRAALSKGDLQAATDFLSQAGEYECGDTALASGFESIRTEIAHADGQRNTEITKLGDTLREQMAACNYPAAAATAVELSNIAPNDSLASIQAQIERLAAIQANVNSLLAAAANPVDDAEAGDTLAHLREIQPQAPQCLGAQIAGAIAMLAQRVAAPVARERIRAAIAACDYVKALAAAMDLQAASPNDDWLKANLGILQAAAAEQSNALSLIRQAGTVASPTEASDLAGRLRQAATTAPACMVDQIQAALAQSASSNGQKPAWLDSPTQPGSQTTADSNLNHARQILQQTTQDEVIRQTLAQQQAQAQQPPQTEPPAPLNNKDTQPNQPQPQKEADTLARQRRLQQRQQTLNNLANTLTGILTGGKTTIPPIPAAGGGAAAGSNPAPDPFIGSWGCHMRLTASRKLPLDGSVQGDYGEMISKNGTGYVVVDGRSGAAMPSISVNGNAIQFGSYSGSGRMTLDFQANGSRMTGTLHVVNNDDSIAAGLQCSR